LQVTTPLALGLSKVPRGDYSVGFISFVCVRA